jgi:hypothetical protein
MSEPGRTHWEGMATGTRAAAAGRVEKLTLALLLKTSFLWHCSKRDLTGPRLEDEQSTANECS